MAISADDLEDMANYLEVNFDEWGTTALAEFERGTLNRAADVTWQSQPDEVKNVFRQRKPEAANILDNLRKGANHGSNERQ